MAIDMIPSLLHVATTRLAISALFAIRTLRIMGRPSAPRGVGVTIKLFLRAIFEAAARVLHFLESTGISKNKLKALVREMILCHVRSLP
jgi:hypothetical protein